MSTYNAVEAGMHYRQQGQVLPLGMALLVFSMLGAYVLYNTGKVVTDKMKLVNTADAAAYSGTLWQARALNFQSYTNRAMVANQVSMAQAVSLRSWVAYGAVSSENIATVLRPVPIINGVAEGLQRGLDIVERVVAPATQALVSLVDVVNRGLSISQEAMFVSTFVATPDVVRAVVAETDSRFTINTGFSGIGLADNLGQWRDFTEGFEKNDVGAMDERQMMINRSLDSFSRERNWSFFRFWFMSSPFLRHRTFREGSTELVRVDSSTGIKWEWKAKDTLSLHNKLWFWRGTKRYELPIGWAEAFANSDHSGRTIEPGACSTTNQVFQGNCTRTLNRNRKGEYLADVGQRSVMGKETRIAMRQYTGVNAYRSLSLATVEDEDPRLRLKVEVSMPVEQVVSTDSLGSRGQFATPVTAPGDSLSSISVAEVYYQRPDEDLPGIRESGLEPANGYNPYWTSKLGSISSTDKLLAFSLRGGSTSSSTPDGIPDGQPVPQSTLTGYVGNQSGNTIYNGSGSTLDTTSLDSQYTSSVDVSVGDFESVAASFDTADLEQFKDDVEQQLVQALKDQVSGMISTALGGSGSSGGDPVKDLEETLAHKVEEQLGEVASPEAVESFQQVIDEAEDLANELEAEFLSIRQRIIAQFQLVFEPARDTFEQFRIPLQVAIDRRVDQLENSHRDEAYIRDELAAIESMRQRLHGRREELHQYLAHELLDIVNQSSNLYYMRLDEALYVVGEFLRSEDDSLQLPWLDWVEEEQSDE